MNKYMNLTTEYHPTPARAVQCDGGVELHVIEPTVMMAMTQWPETRTTSIWKDEVAIDG